MTRKQLNLAINLLIASVWIGFGLFCKMLALEPRHEQIVARILGEAPAGTITFVLGACEVLMALWILSGINRRLNAVAQIAVVATMNLLEAILAADLLLWGRWNAAFAAAFIGVIYVNEWELNQGPAE